MKEVTYFGCIVVSGKIINQAIKDYVELPRKIKAQEFRMEMLRKRGTLSKSKFSSERCKIQMLKRAHLDSITYLFSDGRGSLKEFLEYSGLDDKLSIYYVRQKALKGEYSEKDTTLSCHNVHA